jgi:hypothetical protein
LSGQEALDTTTAMTLQETVLTAHLTGNPQQVEVEAEQQ